MNFERIESPSGSPILGCISPITRVGEANDLISACIEHDTACLLLGPAVLPPDFYALHTRFAGEFLEKLQMYRLRTAVVIDTERDHGERFGEYLREARRARFSRLFSSRDEAIQWLAQEPS